MSVTFKSYRKDVESAEQRAKNRILNRLGAIAEGYAVKLCPVDTGNLRNSITHAQMDANTEVIGTPVEYAPYVELGHHSVAGKWVPAQPYLRPAVENHRSEYEQIIRSELGR